ncbi:MAG: hypothetical protein DDT39_00754 [Firmicutes bacterium]|nr:hypothetical protein [candidate division NPL-UPA2 bacterium]MBT9154088.1 hypothetical protein [candidate division NPL-UPA2 bacterium]
MVERLRRVVLAAVWLIVLVLPLLTGFAMVFFSIQHRALVLNLRPWLIALVVLLLVTAVADARCRKRVAQREEARNV